MSDDDEWTTGDVTSMIANRTQINIVDVAHRLSRGQLLSGDVRRGDSGLNLECGPGFSVHGMRVDQVAGQLTVGQLASRTGVRADTVRYYEREGAALVAEHGLTSVTMSKVAERTGIGRATLYKYFPDVEAILIAWHQRQITGHLAQLTEARDAAADPDGQLEAVLEAYALHQRQHQGSGLAALLHKGEHVTRAQHELHAFITDLVAQGASAGEIRDDIDPGELASYCLHALTAAGSLPSQAAVRRLVTVTLAGLRPA